MAVGPAATPLVGRDQELEELTAALAAVQEGTGGCIVLTGPPGIGKSRLIDFAIQQGHVLDIAVAAGRAAELDRVLPLTTLASTLQQAQPDAIDLAGIRDHKADRFWYLDRLGEAIESYVTTRRLLVAIDDAQWTDELSALALRVLVPALASSPVRWLLARRPVPAPSPAHDAIDWLIGDDAREIRLSPLDENSVERLCSHLLGATADATVLALADRARGNPFLLEQMLRTMHSSGQILISESIATVVGDELPSGFLSAVDQRLRGLSRSTRRLLEAGSVFGRPFTVHAAARLTAVNATELLPGADEGLAAGVLVEENTQLAFAHDLLRQAVYNLIPGPIRATMHREAAAVVAAEGCSPVEIAEHHVRSGPEGDRAAVESLRTAAADLAPRAPGTAADLIARALDRVGEHDLARPHLSAEAVGLLASAGRLVEARELGEAALRGDLEPATEAILLLGLAEALKHAGQNAAAVDYAERALNRSAVPDRTRAQLHAVAAHALLWSDDISRADRAGAEAERLGNATFEHSATVFGSTARSVVARAEGRLEDALRHAANAVAVADETGREALHRHPRIWLGSALVALDRFEEARAVYRAGRKEAEDLGTAWSQPLWHFYHASASAGLGDLDSATAEAEAGLLLAGQLTARQLSVPLLGLLVRIAVLRDQMPLARHKLRQMRLLLDDGVTAAPEDLAWALASFREADGKPDEAATALAYLYARLPDRVLLFSNEPGSAPALVRIALNAGEPAKAEATVAAAHGLASRNPEVASLAGAAAHAEGLLRDDIDALRVAVERFEDSPRSLDRAQAMEDCATAENHSGGRSRAVELVEAALALYEARGAHRATRRAERTLRTLGVRRRGKAHRPASRSIAYGLTEAELAVARRVAAGLTNREVARQLFVSHHTVDSHLRSIFRKLGINGRVELTRYMMTADP